MSLVGNLADLCFGDILQIIALSRKSGILQLATAVDVGAIGFVQGKVVMAVHERGQSSPSELLIYNQLATASQVQDMMKVQVQKPHSAKSQPPILWESTGVSIDAVEAAMKKQIELLVYDMFDWEEGNFSFVVAADVQEVTRLNLRSNRFCVMRGLNPQLLAMEGSRLRDERQRNDPFARFVAKSKKDEDKAREKETSAAANNPFADFGSDNTLSEVVLIDDDPNILRALHDKLRGAVPALSVFTKVDAGLKRVRELLWANRRVVVVSDLILPRSDGAGVLGGLEVLEKIRPDYPNVPVYLLAEYPNEEACERAKELHVSGILKKPCRAEFEKDKTRAVLDPTVTQLMLAVGPLLAEARSVETAPSEELNEYGRTQRMEPITRTLPAPVSQVEAGGGNAFDLSIDEAANALDLPLVPAEALDPLLPPRGRVLNTLSPGLDGPSAANDSALVSPDPSGLIDLRRELGMELGASTQRLPMAEQERSVGVLKSLVFELMSPSSRDTIMLLILRFASELFSRAALLLVVREELWGLGGFANGVKNIDFIATTRKLRVRYDQGSVFETVVREKASKRHALGKTSAEKNLAERLKIEPNKPVFIAPLLSADRVAAILLGDNHQLGKDLGDTHGLEIFLLQAGMALERALLERRLRELAQRDGNSSGE